MQQYSIVKLKEHKQFYLKDVVNAMAKQHRLTHDNEIDMSATRIYCIKHVYCMINKNNDLVGFFSLSRFDFVVKNVFAQFLLLLLNILYGRLFIYDVYIFPVYRKKGYGKLMMSLIIEEIYHNHWYVNSICLHVASKGLVGFYEKCGFQIEKVQNTFIYMVYRPTIS
jgi:GNAT superfamily N-acetyltransferase